MQRKRKKSSPGTVTSKPPKTRVKQTTKMAASNVQDIGTHVINQPIVPQMAQTQPQTPQQFILPPTFQYPQYVAPRSSPTLSQGQNISILTQNDPVLQVILQKIENIELQVGQLSDIRSTVNKITKRLDGMDSRISEIEHSHKFVSDQYDTVSTNVNKNTDHLKEAKAEIKRLQTEIIDLNKTADLLKVYNIDLKCRSMRENLLFFGIPEVNDRSDGTFDVPLSTMGDPDPSRDTNESMATDPAHSATVNSTAHGRQPRVQEDCESKVHIFLTNVLKILDSRANIRIDRAHRMGPYSANKTRPVVAKFCDTKSKMMVKDAPSSVNLRDTTYNVSEHYPPEIQQKRRELLPIMIKARKDGKRATLVRDKLYIDNREYVLPTTN